MQPRGAPGDIRQMISQRYGPLAGRALAAYGVNGANDPQPEPENGTVMLQFTTDNSFRCGTVQELIWRTTAANRGYAGTELIEYDCIEGERIESHYPGAVQKKLRLKFFFETHEVHIYLCFRRWLHAYLDDCSLIN
jgi:hypothetical protein